MPPRGMPAALRACTCSDSSVARSLPDRGRTNGATATESPYLAASECFTPPGILQLTTFRCSTLKVAVSDGLLSALRAAARPAGSLVQMLSMCSLFSCVCVLQMSMQLFRVHQ